jgi:hypothetical protein
VGLIGELKAPAAHIGGLFQPPFSLLLFVSRRRHHFLHVLAIDAVWPVWRFGRFILRLDMLVTGFFLHDPIEIGDLVPCSVWTGPAHGKLLSYGVMDKGPVRHLEWIHWR